MTQQYTKEELTKLVKNAEHDHNACELIAAYFDGSGKIEELAECSISPRFARMPVIEGLLGRSFPGLGKIQTPGGVEGVDFTAYNAEDNILYVANIIAPDSKETLLHSAMQVYRYYTSIEDAGEFCKHCKLGKNAKIKPAVLFFEDSNQLAQSQVGVVRRMLDTMNVDLYMLSQNSQGGFEIKPA